MPDSPFPLVTDWAVEALGSVCQRGGGDVQTGPFGSQLHAEDYVAEGVPSIMPQNIGDNRVRETGIARITEGDAVRLSRYRVRVGDIVYSRRGDVERRALIREAETGWLCGTGCLRVRPGDKVMDSLFLSHYLGHPAVRAWIVRHAVGATMPNLNTSILSSLPVVVPPLPEQRAIAGVLGALDDKIELNRRMNETLEEIARALFKSWFVDFDPVRAKSKGRQPWGMDADTAALFPSEFEDSQLGEIPMGWRVTAVGDAFELNPPRPLRQGEEAAYVEMAALPEGSARVTRVERRAYRGGARFANGDVLLARITPCLENGKTALVDFLAEGEIGAGSTEYIVMQGRGSLGQAFTYCLARDDAFRAYAIANMTGTSGRQRVPTDAIARYSLVAPCDAVADAFGRATDPVLRKLKANDDESGTLAELRNTLLPKLMSGEVRVRDAERAVEAVG